MQALSAFLETTVTTGYGFTAPSQSENSFAHSVPNLSKLLAPKPTEGSRSSTRKKEKQGYMGTKLKAHRVGLRD
jgi:hypothetical protein